MGHRQAVLFLLQVDVGQVQMGVSHAWVGPSRLAVGLDRQVRLALPPVGQAEVVIALRPVRIQLDAAPQSMDGVVKLVKPVVHGPKIDEGPGPQRVQTGHFLEVVGGAGQVVEQEADRRQAIMHVQFRPRLVLR